MEEMIEKIYNHLLVYVDENNIVHPFGDIYGPLTTENHRAKTYQAFKDIDNSLRPDDHQIIMLQKVSVYNNFLVFTNATNYKKSDKCNTIILYSTSELTNYQKEIARYCLEQFRKDNIFVEVGLFDKGQLSPTTIDKYNSLISSETTVSKQKIKQRVMI